MNDDIMLQDHSIGGITSMMGMQQTPQGNLFYYGINIDKRIRPNHLLRRVKELIDFDFSYQEVKDFYGANGNVSVPPSVILKLMLLLVLYNVRSERELMATVPERLDWLWFLDYDLDTEIPNQTKTGFHTISPGITQRYFMLVCQNLNIG